MKPQINEKNFVGKTIAEVEASGVNCIVFKFTDGTSTMLTTEAVLPGIGLYGIIEEKP